MTILCFTTEQKNKPIFSNGAEVSVQTLIRNPRESVRAIQLTHAIEHRLTH